MLYGLKETTLYTHSRIDIEMNNIKFLLFQTVSFFILVKATINIIMITKKVVLCLQKNAQALFLLNRKGYETGRGDGFRYLIPISIEKIHHHPYTCTQQVSNFCPIPFPPGNGYILVLIHVPIFYFSILIN